MFKFEVLPVAATLSDSVAAIPEADDSPGGADPPDGEQPPEEAADEAAAAEGDGDKEAEGVQESEVVQDPEKAAETAEEPAEAVAESHQAKSAGQAETSNAEAGQVEQRESKAVQMAARLAGMKAEGRESLGGLLKAKAEEMAESEFLAAYSAASQFMEDGEYENAVAGWQEVIRLRPGLEDPWSHRGVAKSRLGDLEGAIADFKEALQRDPSKADSWFSLGSAQSDMGNDRAALISFNKTLKLNPQHLEALCCLGTVKLSKGDGPGAIEHCTAALNVDAQCAAARGLRGAARQMSGDFLGSVSDCSEALRLDPELDWVKGVRAEAQKGLKAQGREGDGERRDRGNEHFKRGKLREAIGEYSLAVANKEEFWLLSLSNRAICHLRLGEHAEALADAEECLEQDANLLKAHFTIFKALAALGKWFQAFAALRKLRECPSTEASDAAADKEESAKRREFALFQEAGGCIGGTTGENAAGAGTARSRGESLAWAVQLAVPSEQPPISLLDVLGFWKDEDPLCFASGLQLADESRIRLVWPLVDQEYLDEKAGEPPDEKVGTSDGRRTTAVVMRASYEEVARLGHADELPGLAVLCCPDLKQHFDGWAPTIHHLMSLGCLTVVCGLGTDLSVVQNEDMLRSLGCNIVFPTSLLPADGCIEGVPQQYHVCAFSGGDVDEDFDVSSFKQELRDRGLYVFECESSSSSSDGQDEELDEGPVAENDG